MLDATSIRLVLGESTVQVQASVLMVDDQPARLLTYEAILSSLDVHCVHALSGAEALARLLEQEFAVILLDICMPGMNGFEVARLVREHPRIEKTPIIFLTAIHGTLRDQLRGYEAGAIDVLSVPVRPEVLRSKVAVLVELHRRRIELQQLNRKLTGTREALIAEHARELEEAHEEFSALFERPSEAIVVLQAVRDASGTVEDWIYRNANLSAQQLLGRKREELIGRRVRRFLAEEEAQNAARIWTRVLDTREQVMFETQYGETLYLVTIFPMGRDCVVSAALDITERKLAEAALHEVAKRTG